MPKKATIVSGIALVLLFALIMIITAAAGSAKGAENTLPERISVLFPELKEIRIMKYNEFLGGCVAGMLPDSGKPEPEAIKAVAIALNSRAAYFLNSKTSAENLGADLVVGEDFPFTDSAREEITAITNSALPVLTFEEEPINAQICKISAGVTDEAAPYSPSVPLPCDISVNGCESVTAFTPETVRRSLHLNALPRNCEEWFHDPVYAGSGTLTYIGIGDTKVTGSALRKALELRSTAITVEYREEKFYFRCKGYGENKGLSVNAAFFLAENGNTCEDILSLFYPDCKLS